MNDRTKRKLTRFWEDYELHSHFCPHCAAPTSLCEVGQGLFVAYVQLKNRIEERLAMK